MKSKKNQVSTILIIVMMLLSAGCLGNDNDEKEAEDFQDNTLLIGCMDVTAVNYDINASIEIWKFFSKYDINGLIHQSTSITEYITKKDIIKVIDVLGRQTKHLKNQPLFYIYDDGTVEKKIILE